MIGKAPTLADIVLSEIPDVVDLTCNETMPSEEELDQINDRGVGRRTREQVFVILTQCGRCEADIRLCIECFPESTLLLESLLLRDLQILCPDCYKRF